MDQDSGPCHLEINGANYNINAKGVVVYNSPGEHSNSIQVPLPQDFYIEAVKFYGCSLFGVGNPLITYPRK